MVTVSSITKSYWGGYDGLGNYLWVDSVSSSGDDSVETVVVVSGVMDSSEGTVGFGNGVGAFDYVTITHLLLRFVVTGVGISYSVVEFVFGVCLE